MKEFFNSKKGQLLLIAVLLLGAAAFFVWSTDGNIGDSAADAETAIEQGDFAEYEDADELETVVLREGTSEEAVEVGDTITVHYEGYLTDGTKFDSSYERKEAATFALEQGQLIEGWVQGVPGMEVGEKRRLIIPAELGYGEEGTGPIPGGATLVFDVELLDILRSNEGSN